MKLACPLAFCPSDLLIIIPHPSPLPQERELVGWDKPKRSHHCVI